jgi:hypothetical protein
MQRFPEDQGKICSLILFENSFAVIPSSSDAQNNE